MNFTTHKHERQVDLSWWLARHGFSEYQLERTIANGTTPLMHAARHGASEIARELRARGVALDARNADGNNALWFACFANDLTIIDLLCEAGIDVDNQNANGATCLMYAASAGKAEVVARLLAYGADRTLRSLDDYTALDMASTIECLRLLQSRTLEARAHDAEPDGRQRAGAQEATQSV